MTTRFRDANLALDLPRIVELANHAEPEPVALDQVREWAERTLADRVLRLILADLDYAPAAGYAEIEHGSWLPDGRFYLWLVVDPARRQKGLGAALLDRAVIIAREHGAVELASKVCDDDPNSLQFAQRRGFAIERHLFESAIYLASFDESRFAGLIEAVEASGISFTNLAELGNTPENLRRVWEVNYRAVLDDPASTGRFTAFEDFQKTVGQASWFDPQGQILAADGDQLVGLSAVGYFEQTRSAQNMITGVDRAYRGRHVALALKLLGIRYARAKGAQVMRTRNDSQNGPMLAVNRKLGYQPRSGIYRLLKASA